MIKLPKTHTAKYWEEMLLGMIGEQFDLVASGEVLGLVLSLKYNNDQISVWHRTGSDPVIVQNIRICIEKILGNSAFKGSSAFNKKSAKGADLNSCVQEGIISIDHEIFSALIEHDKTDAKKPKETKPQFERGTYRGRGGYRGGYRPHAESHEEKKQDDDDDGFQTVTAAKK